MVEGLYARVGATASTAESCISLNSGSSDIASGGRFFGSFSNIAMTTRISPSGTSVRSVEIDCGDSNRIFTKTDATCSP